MSEAFERAVKYAFETDWSDLGVEEGEDGALHFPDSIDRRTKLGGLQSTPIMLRLPTNQQRIKARHRAREWIKEANLDEDRDAHIFEEFENFEILAFCIRDPKPPYIQHVPNAQELFAAYPDTTIKKVLTRLNLLIAACDPRFGELSADECWKVAARIAARGDASPLAGIAGFDQSACMVFLAKEALKSPTAPSWVRSPLTMKPAPETSV